MGNILIYCINRREARNRGDQLISASLEKYLAASGHQVASLEYLGPALGGRLPAWMRGILARIDSSIIGIYVKILFVVFYRQPAIYVLGGGQLLRANSTFPHAMLAWAIVMRLRNIPLILHSVGFDVEAGAGWVHRVGLKRLCKAATAISVRDEYSRKYLQEMGFSNAKVVPDVVFLNSPNSWSLNHSSASGIVVFVSQFLLDDNRVQGGFLSLEAYFRRLRELVLGDVLPGEIITVTYSSDSDSSCARMFAEWLAGEKSLSVAVNYVSVESVDEFIGVIRGARHIVSTRMHPIIVAKLFGVKFSVVPFNKKTEDMANSLKTIGLQNLIDDSRDAIDFEIASVRKQAN